MDYRDILREKFEERKRVNPLYSLRSYARDLRTSASCLSNVLAGKSHFSSAKASQIADCLNLEDMVREDFMDTAQALGRGAKTVKESASRRSRARTNPDEVRVLTDDEVAIMADWRNVAVWTFMTLPDFDGSPKTVARHFKMNLIEVEEILRRLERLKMITVNGKTGVVGKTQVYVGGSFPNATIRKFHRQISTLGRDAIESRNFNERHVESALLTIDRSKYGEIQQKVANFCRSLGKEYSDQPTNDSVYGLSMQFFQISDPLP